MREIEKLILLFVSIITYVLLLPLTFIIAIARIIRSVATIIETTLTFFITAVRKELNK